MDKRVGEMNVMCRACLTSDGILLHLYSSGLSQRKLSDKLADLASIEINDNDGIPAVLCSKCAYRTDAFYDFKLQVQASDEKLRKLYSESQTENPSPVHLPENSVGQRDKKTIKSSESVNISDVVDEKTVKSTKYMKKKKFKLQNISKEEEEDIFNPDDNVTEYFILPNSPDLSTDKYESSDEKANIKSEIPEMMDDNSTSYTLCYSPPQVEFIDSKEDGKSDKRQMKIESTENLKSRDVKKEISEIQKQNISNSGDNTDPDENLLGSVNDTLVKIKETKLSKGSIEYQCTLCKKNYDDLASMLIHTVDNHIPSTGPFFCVVCEKDCDTRQQLRAHVTEHTGRSPYTCFLCDKAYTTRRYLKRHMVCHPNFARYRCAKCGERFKMKSELDLHIQTHVDGAPPFSCSQCPRSFNHKGNYKNHLISHLDPKRVRLLKYPCTICGKRFLNNRVLETHLRVHTGEKPYSCDVCKRTFSQHGNMVHHSKIHSNPRAFSCEVCGKKFNQRSTLRDHSLLHTGEKPYLCSVCGSSFTFSAALRRHMWLHADEKPFQCDFCESKFLARYDLNRHMKVHSDKSKQKRQKNKSKVIDIIPEVPDAMNNVVIESVSGEDNIVIEDAIFEADSTENIIEDILM